MSLALGALLAAASLAAWGALAFEGDPQAGRFALQTTLHLAFGRETAIPAALATGTSWPLAFVAAQALEWSMLLLGFPLIVLFGEGLHHIGPIRRVLDRAESFAKLRPDAGILLLGAMTLVPWLPLGALTAVFIGEAVRLPSRKLVPVVALAELVANLSFAYFTAVAAARFPDPRLAAAAFAGLFLVLSLAAAFWPRRRRAQTPLPAPAEEA